jgi:hypothetical protein
MKIPIPTPVLTGSGSKGSPKASQDRQAQCHRATPGLGRIVQERQDQCYRAILFCWAYSNPSLKVVLA